MKQSIALMALVALGLEAGRWVLGDAGVLVVVPGAMALMALMIAATFLWLWVERATPLALGMVYAWAGAAVFIGWEWVYTLSGGADWAWHPHLGNIVQALYLVGALLHFSVIHRSFGFHGAGFLWPVALALSLSTLVSVLV